MEDCEVDYSALGVKLAATFLALQALEVFKFANVVTDVAAVGNTIFVVGAEGYCLLMT
jgi:hypothetical protein